MMDWDNVPVVVHLNVDVLLDWFDRAGRGDPDEDDPVVLIIDELTGLDAPDPHTAYVRTMGEIVRLRTLGPTDRWE